MLTLKEAIAAAHRAAEAETGLTRAYVDLVLTPPNEHEPMARRIECRRYVEIFERERERLLAEAPALASAGV